MKHTPHHDDFFVDPIDTEENEPQDEEQKENTPVQNNVTTSARASEILHEGLVILPKLENISVNSSDKETTEQDLLQINTVLFALHQALPHVRSVQSLVSIGKTVSDLIKTRRGVKKLQFGTAKDSGSSSANSIEVL